MFNYIDDRGGPRISKIVWHVVILLVGITIIFGSFGVVGAQERGVKVRLGVVHGAVKPGPYLKFPLIESVVKMDVKTQSLEATKEAPLSAASNDLQDTKLAVVINYHIDPTTVENIYVQYGDADTYYTKVVEPLIVATVKATASQYTAAEQIQKRLDMQAKALFALEKAFEGKNVVIEKADITDVSFSPEFTHAIEAKVTAVQQAEAAKNKLEQVKFEAQQQIETAKATAESQRIQAQSLAAQGGSDYIQLKAIEKWDGHMPQYMIPGAATPILDLRKVTN